MIPVQGKRGRDEKRPPIEVVFFDGLLRGNQIITLSIAKRQGKVNGFEGDLTGEVKG
jgi:hypothetical protein